MHLSRHSRRWHTRRSLHDRLHRSIKVADLAAEYPIQWIEEVDAEGRLVDAPGHGHRAIWKNHDCSFASALVISSTDPYFTSDAHMSELRRGIAEVMMQLDFGEEVQLLWFPWDDAHELIERYRATRPDDPPFVKWWHRTRSEREYSRLDSGDLRCFRSVIALNITPDKDSRLLNPYEAAPGLAELWGTFGKAVELGSILKQNLDGLNREQYAAMALRLHKRMQTLSKVLGGPSGMFEARPWTARELFSYLRRQWTPDQWEIDRIARGGKHTLAVPRADAVWAPFASYFLPASYTMEDFGDCFRFGPYWHRILSMNTLPQSCDVGFISAALTIPESVRGIKNMTVAMTARGMDNTAEMIKLRTRIRHLGGQMKGNDEHNDNKLLIQEATARITELRKATRPAMFKTQLHVHLWEKDRSLLHEREHSVKAALGSYMEMGVDSEDCEALPFVFGFEQPGYTRYDDESRMFSLVPVEIAAVSAVSAYNDGCINPGKESPVPILIETDTGVPQGVDLWADRKVANYGGVGVGEPGSGKSNFYQQIILAYANRMTDIVVIDGAEQPSFRPICTLLGGTYIEFNDEFRMNPLATAIGAGGQQMNPTSEEMTHIIITLGAMFRPGKRPDPLETSVLTSAVRFIFENRLGDGSRVRLADLTRGLAPDRFASDDRQRSIASEFLRVLEETWLGRYGLMMSGTEELPSSWLTVFDVRWLSSNGQEQLQAVVVSLLFRYLERISRANIARTDGTKRQILAIIDEAWKAAKNPAMLAQIVAGYRTGRARHMSMHLLSQSMQDVLDLLQMDENGNVTGKCDSSPILECCSHHFLFKMNEESAVLAKKAFGLTESQTEALSKLGGDRNVYRDFVYLLKTSSSQPKVFTKLRSRILPEEVWATTTSQTDSPKRSEMNNRVLAEMSRPGARRRIIEELRKAGWEIDDTTNDDMLRQSIVIHRLAHPEAAA